MVFNKFLLLENETSEYRIESECKNCPNFMEVLIGCFLMISFILKNF